VGYKAGTIVAGKYRIERQLGQGGMGAVYAAINTSTEGQVALKVLHAQLRGRSDLVRRFLQEARAAPKVIHPGVARVFDAGEDGPLLWIAMELLEGESLAQRIERDRLGLEEMVTYFEELLEILAEVHRQGIVHRDLKPENVFLQQHARGRVQVRLLDFGIAKLRDSKLGTHATQTGVLMGTPGYMSPEQTTRAREVDAKTDLYAVGVMLYLCISGRMPYQADTLPELIQKQHTEPPAALPETADPRLRELGAVALRCLSVDRDQRPRDAASLAWQLVRAAARETAPPAPAVERANRPLQAVGARQSARPARETSWSPLWKWCAVGLFVVGAARSFGAGSSADRSASPTADLTASAGGTLASDELGAKQPKKAKAGAANETNERTRPAPAPIAPKLESGSVRPLSDAQRLASECDGGRAQACYDLAIDYLQGESVERDEAESRAYAERSCIGNLGAGCYLAGLLSQEGRGGKKDLRLAKKRFDSACELGSQKGCNAAEELRGPP
jgi:eukaryotic-like serine/threonine-protein kinase